MSIGRFRDSLRVDRTNESRPDSSSGCEDSFGAKFGARFCRVKRSDSEHFDECCYFHFHFPSLPLILSTSLRLFIMAEKRVTRKFAVEEDICLLKEVIALGGDNPFLKSFGSETWLSVSRAVAVQHPKMEGLSGRAAKERAEKIEHSISRALTKSKSSSSSIVPSACASNNSAMDNSISSSIVAR